MKNLLLTISLLFNFILAGTALHDASQLRFYQGELERAYRQYNDANYEVLVDKTVLAETKIQLQYDSEVLTQMSKFIRTRCH